MKFCPHCGIENTAGGRFCTFCGQEIQAAASPQSPKDSEPIQQEVPAYEQPIQATSSRHYSQLPEQQASPKKKTTYTPVKILDDKDTLPFLIIGWVSVFISLLSIAFIIFIPIVFGGIGTVMGVLLRNKGYDTHGIIMIIVSVSLALLAFFIAYEAFGY